MSDLDERARNRTVRLAGHFTAPVRVETVEDIGQDMLLVRVRTADGLPSETTVAVDELEAALAPAATVPAEQLFRWVESHRIRLAYAHDPYFEVSMSGVRGPPTTSRPSIGTCYPSPGCASCWLMTRGAGKRILAACSSKSPSCEASSIAC